jgi:hypothetical protein
MRKLPSVVPAGGSRCCSRALRDQTEAEGRKVGERFVWRVGLMDSNANNRAGRPEVRIFYSLGEVPASGAGDSGLRAGIVRPASV